MPYGAARAIDGGLLPASRWLSREVPSRLEVDLGRVVAVAGWAVWHLPRAGWPAPDYVLRSYSLQASLDGATWQTLDAVVDNRNDLSYRRFDVQFVRHLRLHVQAGLWVHPTMASVLEWAVFESPVRTSSRLQSLTLSAGTLTPPFQGDGCRFTVDVPHAVDSITITPVTEDPRATVRVNNDVVAPGASFGPFPLTPSGRHFFDIVVAPLCGPSQAYHLEVYRPPDHLEVDRPPGQGIAHFLGQIALFSPQAVPPGWVECAGQTLKIDGRNQHTYSLIGNQFGSGSGRAAATAAGFALGASVAHDNEYRRYYNSAPRYERTVTERRCAVRENYRSERQLIGYDVTYDYNGTIGRTFSERQPGTEIRVRVAVEPAD